VFTFGIGLVLSKLTEQMSDEIVLFHEMHIQPYEQFISIQYFNANLMISNIKTYSYFGTS